MMKYLLEFAKFKNLKNDIYYQIYSNAEYTIYSYKMINNIYNSSRIELLFMFNAVYRVEILFNTKEFSVEIEYFDEFVLTGESQEKLIKNILNDNDILNEIEECIFEYAPDTSIEEFKELLKKPIVRIYES